MRRFRPLLDEIRTESRLRSSDSVPESNQIDKRLQRDGDVTTSIFTFCETWQQIVQGLARAVDL